MKKLLYIFFIFITADFFIFAAPKEDFKWNASFYDDYKFKGAELKFSQSIPNNDFSTTPDFKKYSWGASFNAEKIVKIPVTVKTGKLSAGGSFSKLKNPCISGGASPFSSTTFTSQKLSATLPSASGWSKPYGAFEEIYFIPKKTKNKFYLSFYQNEEDSISESFLISIAPSKTVTFSLSETAGVFKVSNSSQKWFSQAEFFPETDLFCGLIQGSFYSNILKSKLSFNLYQNIFNKYDFTFAAENGIFLGPLQINLGFFRASSAKIILPDSSLLKTVEQTKINPFFTWFLKNKTIKFKTGIIYVNQKKVDSSGSFYDTNSCGLGLLLNTRNHWEKLTFSTTKDGSKSAEYSIHCEKLLKPTGSAKYSFKLPQDTSSNTLQSTVTSSISIKPQGFLSIRFLTSLNFTDSEFNTGNTKISLNFNKKGRYMLFSATSALQYNF